MMCLETAFCLMHAFQKKEGINEFTKLLSFGGRIEMFKGAAGGGLWLF
jgi:hypothetical protein